jgi:RNA polymerase sigma-70 factor (ECF subfamily)
VINGRQQQPLSQEELDDVVQETLTQIWRRLDSYRGLASLQTWAYRFAALTFSSHRRALGRRVPGEDGPSAEPQAPPDRSADFAWVHAAIERLREPDLSIVRHRHFDHMGFGSIASRLGIPESSAKAAYHRALERLRDLLGAEMREGVG